jgi:DNA-directed RNA polymerase subunit RPC12/RpoP
MQNYSCKNCGAELYWDTQVGCLKCKFCDAEFQASDFEDHTVVDEPVKNESMDKEYVNSEGITDDMSVYECKNCGGEVVTLNTTMATICPYCGEAISITSKSVGDFRPELCIPFKKDKKQIVDIYKNYVSGSFLAPKEFKEQSTIEKIQGLFTPFYLHSINNKAKHAFEGEILSSHKRGYDKVTTHKVYSLTIDADGKFEKIPTDASKRIENSLMEAIEPFDYNECKSYNPAYMAGFMAEQTDDDVDDMNIRAETRSTQAMREKAHSAFRNYSSVRQINESIKISQHTSQYVLLPVWLLNVKHGDKKYTFAINGQTGKVVGKLPIDKLKLFLIGGGSLLVADIAIALFGMFFG